MFKFKLFSSSGYTAQVNPSENALRSSSVEGDDFQFDGYPENTRVATKYVDQLADEELRELNQILRWNCFTVDSKGRRFGRRAKVGKRDSAQAIPDRRLKIMNDEFNLKSKHVLEVGCFEGVHTIGLCGSAAKVTAIDSRIENVVKTIVRCALFDCHPTVFKCDLEVQSDMQLLPKVDLLHHVGVLYHLVDPVRHLLDICKTVQEGILLDTHVARPGEDTVTYESCGKSYRYKWFREGGKNAVFAGMGDHAKWLTTESLLEVLRDAGFSESRVVEERDERNGFRVLVLARQPHQK